MADELEIRTPTLRATARSCCGDRCLPILRQYPDEPDQWWVICGCGESYRFNDPNLYWIGYTPDHGWRPVDPHHYRTSQTRDMEGQAVDPPDPDALGAMSP